MLVKDNTNVAKCDFKSKTWFDIGKLIFNLTNGSDEGYNLWAMYSKYDQKNFNESCCIEYWVYLMNNA